MEFSNDGTKMFVLGFASKKINEYALSSVYPIAVRTPFVTTWQTTSANEAITIPAEGTYGIDWGDGFIDTPVNGTRTHEYASVGIYTVSIYGDLESISLAGNRTNAAKLLSIDQWGDIEWTTMAGAFEGAQNMDYYATDTPNLSNVTDMSAMFAGASDFFTGDLSSWDVSSVTDMNYMFAGASSMIGGTIRLGRLVCHQHGIHVRRRLRL